MWYCISAIVVLRELHQLTAVCSSVDGCVCLPLQLLKVYALARVTPAAVRQLLSVMGLHNNTPAAAASSPAAAAAAKPTSKPSIRPSAGAKDKAAPPAAPATTEPATPAVVEPGSMPPDEVLSSSNVYCTAEACLLAWMNAHFVKAFPKLVSRGCGAWM